MRGFYETHSTSLNVTSLHGLWSSFGGSDPMTLPHFAHWYVTSSVLDFSVFVIITAWVSETVDRHLTLQYIVSGWCYDG